jgi:hypothetical protein
MNGMPIVNLNGATKQSLADVRITARAALQEAMKALSECAPNGRDYQTAPAGEYEIALATYRARFAVLDKMANELEDEAIAILDQ